MGVFTAAIEAYDAVVKERDEAIKEQRIAVECMTQACRDRDTAIEERDANRTEGYESGVQAGLHQSHDERYWRVLGKWDEAIKERDEAIKERDEAIKERDEANKERNKAIALLDFHRIKRHPLTGYNKEWRLSGLIKT